MLRGKLVAWNSVFKRRKIFNDDVAAENRKKRFLKQRQRRKLSPASHGVACVCVIKCEAARGYILRQCPVVAMGHGGLARRSRYRWLQRHGISCPATATIRRPSNSFPLDTAVVRRAPLRNTRLNSVRFDVRFKRE